MSKEFESRKKKTRASSRKFLLENITVIVIIHTVYTVTFWLNAFPNMSEKQWVSQREIITGLTVDYKCWEKVNMDPGLDPSGRLKGPVIQT